MRANGSSFYKLEVELQGTQLQSRRILNTIKAVFFDVGATLLTPAEDEGKTFSQIARELNVDVNPSDVMSKVPIMYTLYEQLYEQDDSFWSDDVRSKAIWIEMYEYMASLLDVPRGQRRKLAEAVHNFYFSPGAWKTYDDVIPTLDSLKAQGYRMGLISNWDSSLAPVIEGLGMTHYFETIISSAVVRMHKPMPEIFQLALNRLGISANEAAHVGDHVYADAEGAAGAGIMPLLLDRRDRHTSFEGLRIASLSEIEELIKNQ